MAHPSRRNVLAGLAACSASAWLEGKLLSAQAPQSPRRIDLHQHFYALEPLKPFFSNFPANILAGARGWTPAKAIEVMDTSGVATAFVSCPVRFSDDDPGVREDVVRAVRQINDYGAKLVSDYKGRFGLFALLPLPDIDASLREIEYAFDTLKADGVGLVTSYGNRWLGDKAFQPVFDELNRRNAVVCSHPIDGPCCHNLLPDTGPGTVEWPTDTSRSIWSLINDGPVTARTTSMATRQANVTFIWAHAGGSLLGLVSRFLGDAASRDRLAGTPEPNSRLHHLRRFYYDTAIASNPIQMQGLKALVGASQIVFGSDAPFVAPASVAENLQAAGFSAEELRGVDRENALRFLPRWR